MTFRPEERVAFIMAATKIGPLLVNRLDFCRLEETPLAAGSLLLETGDFEPSLGTFVRGVLTNRRAEYGDGVTVLDVGANIGAFTVSWARHMDGWGLVVAIEAQERLFYALAGNLTLNNIFNAKAIWAAAGMDDGTMMIPKVNYQESGSYGNLELQEKPSNEFIGQPVDYDALIPVPAMRIDSLKLQRCDLLKIDVEGMEMEVIAGAASTLARCKPIIIAETYKTDKVLMAKRLTGDFGYEVRTLGKLNCVAIHRDDPTRKWIEVAE
jgi:FkbM family methyltransferase